MIPAAHQLEGMVLDGGWKVLQRYIRPPQATGGCFSVGYLVEGEKGRQAFLKALDFSRVAGAPDPPRLFEELLRAYNFERDILTLCGDRRLDRVVKALDHGSINISGMGSLDGMVPYLIFEKAEGDLRSQFNLTGKLDAAISLRTLHQVANGLKQLHGVSIAHQDLKPSNVVVFGEADARITDLGSASHRAMSAPRDEFNWAGDANYTPPELLYGSRSPDWHVRRLGCDAYMLGSLAVFLFTGASFTPLVLAELPDHQRPGPGKWAGTYSEVLPLVRLGFGSALSIVNASFIEQGVGELTEIVRQLCDPDPANRGHPKNLGTVSNQFSMERYISKFNLMANRMEAGFWKKV